MQRDGVFFFCNPKGDMYEDRSKAKLNMLRPLSKCQTIFLNALNGTFKRRMQIEKFLYLSFHGFPNIKQILCSNVVQSPIQILQVRHGLFSHDHDLITAQLCSSNFENQESPKVIPTCRFYFCSLDTVLSFFLEVEKCTTCRLTWSDATEAGMCVCSFAGSSCSNALRELSKSKGLLEPQCSQQQHSVTLLGTVEKYPKLNVKIRVEFTKKLGYALYS